MDRSASLVVVPLWLLSSAACGPTTGATTALSEPAENRQVAHSTADPISESAPVELVVTDADRQRVEAVREREGAVLYRDARWKAYVERTVIGVTDPDEAYARGYAAGRILTERGIARLNAALLDRWSDLRLAMAETSQQACAGLWTGDFSEEANEYALAHLGDTDLADLMRLIAEAGLAELAATAPLEPDPEGIQLGIAALHAHLLPEDSQRFANLLAGEADAPSDHCFGTMVLHGRIRDIDPATRSRFLRALALSMAH